MIKEKPIHTIITTDKNGIEYKLPFLHDLNDLEYKGYLCKGCNRVFSYKTSIEDKRPFFIGYQWDKKLEQWEKVEYCEYCVMLFMECRKIMTRSFKE